MKFTHHWTVCLPALAICLCASAQNTPSQRLATEFTRTASIRAMAESLTVDGLSAAIMLAQEAVQLDAESAAHWRLLLDMAILAEREDLKQQCLEQLTRLDPGDETVQLMRLNAAIERFPTVDQRSAAFEKLLGPENRQRIGPAMASRLALDYALLHRREGDNEKFGQWLSESLKLDSSNRSAAAIAAGFFRMNVHDAVGEAELLTNLMIADPTDIATQVALAQVLLEHGAYAAADRLYSLALQCTLTTRNMPSNNMLADRAVAQWAKGDDEAALETLRQRQSEMDQVYRNQVRAQAMRDNRDIDVLELNKLTASADPTLAAVAAAIHVRRNDDQAAASIAAAIGAYQARIDASKASTDKKPDPADLAGAYLEMAWVAVWLGGNLDQVQGFITAADGLEPLTQEAKDRFEGWQAYRRGDFARAVELLTPTAPTDTAARLGLALALLAQQQREDAARELLEVNRNQPGSLMGIWAAGKLAEILGQRVPLSEEAVKLEQLIASIPASFDRYPRDGSMAIGLRVIPSKLTFQPYEPITFDLEITNNALLPLALDRDGPIRPQAVIAPAVRSANARNIGEMRAIVLNVGRKLRLAPREKMVVHVNLRDYLPGDVLNALAVNGSIIKLTALINFTVTPAGNLEASLFGREIEAPLMRLEGENITKEWIEQTIANIQSPNTPEAQVRMALLSHHIAPRTARDAAEEDVKLIESARTAFAEAYQKLEPAAQAWILSVMPADTGPAEEGLQPVLAMAKKSEHRLVQLAYLLYQTTGANDPMLDAAVRGEDPVLRYLAKMIQSDLQKAASRPAAGK